MREIRMVMAGAGLAALLLAGCTAKLTEADRNLLNQALEAGRGAAQSAQRAETAAGRAEVAAQ
jgi:hypothetical protein